ncbi:MAG: DUF4919 domain-containing protein [Bacteroidia bacterium]|nr:DUF4919 domain-containing protein [Bacteroidia bacterium]MCF8427720.1 DUF4919 domain-containing protein [Bacteroidia bacterium]
MKLISLLLLLPSLCFGQDTFRKVNLKEIEKTLSNQTEYNYPKLMERYLDKDTTLTGDEFFYLYYGQAIQEKYSPYGGGDDKKLKEILNKKEEHSDKELEKIISLSEKILKDVPFDLDYWLYITYANKMLNRESERQKSIFMYQGILNTIYSTGDGKTEETAFWVIKVDNEYTMLRWLDLKFGGKQALTANRCDRLSLKKNDQDLDALYFNVSILFESMSKLFNKGNKK